MEPEQVELDIDDGETGDKRPGTALARVRAVSVALSEAARRTRLSTRRAARLSSGGFENRRGARFVRIALMGSFIGVFVVPTLAAIAYFGFIAANQYVAEAEFTVSAGESPLRDGVDSLTGIPMQLILQDTQIITNFLHSREIVDELNRRIGLKALYSTNKADFLARFNAKRPVERLVKYWQHVSTAKIKLPGGLVSFDVRAFSPHDVKLISDTTLALCEELVNRLNERINRDAVSLAQIGLQRATERLSKTFADQEIARNQSGILETKMSADAIAGLLRPLKGSLLNLSGAYDMQLKYMNADTAQMTELKARIDVLRDQIAKLEGRLTTSDGGAGEVGADGDDADLASLGGGSTIAAAMVKFGELDVEQKADEQLYANAASALEHARIAAENKLIYLKVYVEPEEPQESEYPERGLDIVLTAISSLAAWGVLVAVAAVVRNNMA